MPNKSPPEKLFGFIPELSSAPNFCHKFEFEQKVLEEENLASAEPGMIISWGTLVFFFGAENQFQLRLFTYLVGSLKTSSTIKQTRLKSNMSVPYEMMPSNCE